MNLTRANNKEIYNEIDWKFPEGKSNITKRTFIYAIKNKKEID